MSDSRIGGYPMGVTDATIERYFGGNDEDERSCGDCKHFCYAQDGYSGVCSKRFEEEYNALIRGFGHWEAVEWARDWVLDNIFDTLDGSHPCREYEEA